MNGPLLVVELQVRVGGCVHLEDNRVAHWLFEGQSTGLCAALGPPRGNGVNRIMLL
jgi:hypothetical protein